MKLFMYSLLIAIASSSILPEDNQHIWAVLVAGSYSYSNYRHQVKKKIYSKNPIKLLVNVFDLRTGSTTF